MRHIALAVRIAATRGIVRPFVEQVKTQAAVVDCARFNEWGFAAPEKRRFFVDRIDVSLATVKWHLQNLYTKLGVANRSAALATASVLNLLPR